MSASLLTEVCRDCRSLERSLYKTTTRCRSCYEKDLRRRNPEFAERQRQNRRDWERRNPEKVTALRVARKTDPRKAAIDRATKARRRIEQYGITVPHWHAMHDKQGGKCAVCRKPPRPGKKLCVDHNHKTGAVRGLLCKRCNTALGFFYDEPLLMELAADYLRGTVQDVFGRELHTKFDVRNSDSVNNSNNPKGLKMAKTEKTTKTTKTAPKKSAPAAMKLGEWLHKSARARNPVSADDLNGLREKVKASASDKSAREIIAKVTNGELILKRYDGAMARAGRAA